MTSLAGISSPSEGLTANTATFTTTTLTNSGTYGANSTYYYVLYNSNSASTDTKGQINENKYIDFTATVPSDLTFTPSKIQLVAIGRSTGNNAYKVVFIDNSTTTTVQNVTQPGSGSESAVDYTFTSPSTYSEGTTLTIRVYLGINNSNSGRGVGLRDVKLIGTYETAKTVTSEVLKTSDAVKVDDTALTKDAGSNGYSVSSNTITLTEDQGAWAVPSNIELVKTVTYDDASTADVDVAVSFDGTVTDGYYIGTASIGLAGSVTEYTVKVLKKGGWTLFDGSVDTDFASSPITYKGVSMTYSVTGSKSLVDVSSRTNNIGNGKSYTNGYSMSTSTTSNNYISFTIPAGYTATFTHAFAATGNSRTIMLGSSAITSTTSDNYIATLATTPSSGGSGVINGGEYTTPLTAGTYYICGIGGGWITVELNFNLTASTNPPATITFDPATGSSVGAGSEITLTSTGATTILYQWASSAVDGEGDWSSAETYGLENKPEVPAYGSANNVLSVKASNTYGDTYGSATYTITAPTYTITYTAGEGTGTMAATTDITEGSSQALTANAFTRDFYSFSHWTADVDVTVSGSTVTAGNAIADEATIENITEDITLTAQWTNPQYASSLDFTAVTLGGLTGSTAISDFLASANMVASNLGTGSNASAWDAQTIAEKYGFWGYKLKNSGATVKFLVQAGKRVSIILGSVGANATLKKGAASSTITANSGDLKETVIPSFVADEDMVVSLTTSSSSTVTLKRIYIVDDAASVSGTISASGWNTFASEYPLDLSTISGGEAYYARTTSGNNVTVTSTTNKVIAGEGLMINGTPGETFTINVNADATAAIDGNLLRGVPVGGTVKSADHNYVFGWPTATPANYGFYLVNSTAPVLAAGKSFLHLSADLTNEAPFLSMIFDDGETTNISNLNVNDNLNIDAPRYNLSGQQVGKDYKGIVIVNGKKYINK